MRVFVCESCGQMLFFENSLCLSCRSTLGYLPKTRALATLTKGADSALRPAQGGAYRRCANAEIISCNWMIPDESPATLCASCVLTRTRPADTDEVGFAEWVLAEKAKRRLLFQLAEIGLPVAMRDEGTGQGVAFDLLSSVHTKVVTGHDDGVITLDLAEADDPHREQVRVQLDEPYRTVLGHFRHEIGHYFWPILVVPTLLDGCRTLFGDDRSDYGDAVKTHYDHPAEGWENEYVSRYATMHPYEDWAESFAHYLHLLDLIQTAARFNIGHNEPLEVSYEPEVDATRPDRARSFDEVIERWLALSYALNQLSRSIGQGDLYPFILTAPVIEKLRFVDCCVRARLFAT